MNEKKRHEITTKNVAQQILNDVPEYSAFYFFNGFNKYSGVHARSLIVFSNELKKINKTSLNFHFKRRDFEKWIRTTIRDSTLADEISKIKRSLDDDELLEQICQLVEKRLKDLKQVLANEEPYVEHDDDL